MCGFVVTNLNRVDSFNEALDSLSHRGPDNQSSFYQGGWAFGHVRLSLVDLSQNSNQPVEMNMIDSTFVFNGEIFNFREFGDYASDTLMLKNELQKILTSNNLSKDLSIFLNKLNGFFSITIMYQDILICIRDRFGEKPHYLHYDKQKLISTSEIKAIKKLINIEIETNALRRISLNPFSFITSEISDGLYDTCYKNVFELKPGHIILYKEGRLESSAWYNLKEDIEKYRGLDTEELYLNAIKIRTNSDAPGCFTLSGGVDSTANCIAGKKLGLKNIKSFSLISATEKYSEQKDIVYNAKLLGIKNHLIKESIKLNQITYEDIVSYIRHFDTPYFDPNISQFHLYSEIKSAKFKYTIDGHGADELLSGYQWHLPHLFVYSLFNFNFSEALYLLKYFFQAYPDNYTTIYKIATFLRGVINVLFIDRNEIYFGYNCHKSQSVRFREVFSQVMLRLLNNYDITSMRSSIEIRTPFLDHRFVANILSKENNFFVGRRNKPWLREFISKNSGIKIMDKKIGLRSYIWDYIQDDCLEKLFSLYDKASKSNEFNKFDIIDKRNLRNLSPTKEQMFWKLVSYQVIKESV